MEVGGWVQVSLGIFCFCLENRPKIALNQYIYFWSSIPYMCILTVYALQKVVGYYDLSVLSMSVMGLDRVRSIQFFFGFLEFFKLCKPP